MVRGISLFAVALLVALVGNSLAGDKNEAVSNPFEMRFDFDEISRTEKVVKELSHEVDLWHDAILKRNGKRLRKHQRRIFSIIESDLKSRNHAISRYELEAKKSVANVVPGVRNDKTLSRTEKHSARDDIRDLRKARQLIKAKELLFDSIKRSDAFSNRYRLLGDYLKIVKRESRLNRVELAEDVHRSKRESFE